MGTLLEVDYRERTSLLPVGGRRADCRELAGALVAVEQRWIAYSVQRKQLTGSLDAAHAAADRGFYAATDSVESGYERSGCPRP